MLPPDNPLPVFVVIPAFNEQAVIGEVLQDLVPLGYQLLVVDDGSTVNLKEKLMGWPVTVLRHRVNLGQGAALQTGIRYALAHHAGYVVTFDADGQHRASDIARLLQPLLDNKADIVLGSRFLQTDNLVPAGRRRLLKTARLVNYVFTGLLLTDAHNGLRALNRHAAASIQLRQPGMAHATEIIAEIRKKKLRFTEVPVSIRYTTYSKQKGQQLWSSFRIFFDILLGKIFR